MPAYPNLFRPLELGSIVLAKRELAPALERAGRKPHLIGGAKEAGELDAKRAMLEGAELAAAL